MQDLLITAGITQLLAESGTNQQSMETMPFSLSPEEITAALAEHEALESKIDLYPNPTTDLVHITGASFLGKAKKVEIRGVLPQNSR